VFDHRNLLWGRPNKTMPMHLDSDAVAALISTNREVCLKEVRYTFETAPRVLSHPAQHPAQTVLGRSTRVRAEHPVVRDDRDLPRCVVELSILNRLMKVGCPLGSSVGIKGVKLTSVETAKDVFPLTNLLTKREAVDPFGSETIFKGGLKQF
jgi:hypothetical protein